jgi:capsular polysaccharide biosynthesis protein
VFLNVLVSIFLGTLLGVGLALMLELSQRYVRSAQDLAEALELPVLGRIGSAAAPRKSRLKSWLTSWLKRWPRRVRA